MTKLTTRLEALEDYLDDRNWWQRTYWPVWRFWDRYKPHSLYMEAKYFIQRGRRGYSDRDLWNLDGKIAREVLAFLDMDRMGITFGGSNPNQSWAASKNNSIKNEVEIRWLMEQAVDGWNFGDWTDPAYRKRVDRANRLFGKYWMSLWD